MPSGKQSRRRRQAAAPPPVRTRGAPRQASPRVLLVAGAVLVAVVIAVVLGVVLTRGGSSSSAGTTKLDGAADVTRLLKGIPQHGNVLGKPSAPVTLVEYVDLQCPFCQQFETSAMPGIVRRYVRTGKLKVVARPIAFIGPDSQRGRDAALAAGRQNKLFDFAQLLYLNQGAENTGWLSDDVVKAAAASIPGLAVQKLLDERGSSAVSDEAHALDAEASADGVHATPTILVGRSGTKPKLVQLASPSDAKSVERAVDAALT
jgi:protein-disulfide isomerase